MKSYKLTCKDQYNKKCVDGKSRNFLLFFLNDVQILKQKIPFDESYDRGFDKRTAIYDIYLLNGKIYQTRTSDVVGCGSDKHGKTRNVKFPVSKSKLEQFNIPKDLKIELNEGA